MVWRPTSEVYVRRRSILLFAAILLAGSGLSTKSWAARVVSPLRDQFRSPAPEHRPLVRWWWFGVAVTNEEIERELVQMRDAGFGGVEIQPVSPLTIYGTRDALANQPYLSQDFLNALGFAATKAKALGLTVDIALGSGWPLGGPHIKPEHSARMLGSDPSKWPAGVPTFEQPRAAAIGAEGWVLDHYDNAAVADHLRVVGDKLVAAIDKTILGAVFSDRLEVSGSDWTSDFAEQFKRRRGYEVDTKLYSLSSKDLDTADLRHDWAMTLSELLDERFFTQLQDWSHGHQVTLRGQTNGTLPSTLSSAHFMDIPEGEGMPWNSLTAMRWASSAAHLFGKPVASAQVWRNAPPTFRASPLDLKIEADQAFLAGASQIVGCGWPYSPAQAGNPGWAFNTAAVVNAHNPWWPVMPELSMYLRRTSFALRQGESVSDVAVYLPTHDAWAMLAPGDVNLGHALSERIGPDLVPAILRAGYNFDLIDDNALQNLSETSGKHLKIGRQQSRAIILPNVERIPLHTLEKLEAFVANGGTLIATRRVPSRLPSRGDSQEDAQRLDTMLAKLFSVDKAPAAVVHDELGELSGLLRKLLEPDMRTAMVAPHIGFVHRRASDVDIYFLANTWNVPYANTIELRVPPQMAEWWDPMTGDMSLAEVASSTATSTAVRVSLPAYGSKILVFGLAGRGRPPKASKPAALETPVASMEISNGWDVTFEGTAVKRQIDWLTSWTESADTRSFSGEAVYRKIVTIAQPKLLGARKVVLSLGEAKPSPPSPRPNGKRVQAMLETPVREAAIVLINGQRAGSVWRPPYELELGKRLREGENKIEIHVFNLGINQLAGKPLGDFSWLNAKSVGPVDPQGKEPIVPLPAGLFGPVNLIATN